MSRSARADVPVLPVVVVVGLLSLVGGLANLVASGPQGGVPATGATISIARLEPGRTVPSGFLGLSLEYPAVEAYAGSDAGALDPVFVHLIRALTPRARPVIRIGGDSSDSTWWPAPGIRRPPVVRYALSATWLRVTAALTRALHATLIVGLNLEANDSSLAAAEQRALSNGLPQGSIAAYQLGNEPELYGTFTWYRAADGHRVTGRPHAYAFPSFLSDFTRFAAALPGVALAGPTTGGFGWDRYLDRFVGAEPPVKLVTLHRYPLQLCFVARSSPHAPTVAHLLAPEASSGFANGFRTQIRIAHAHGLRLRIDELNTVSCGADRPVSQTFASALWVLDSLFGLVRAGADGVNIHTFPGAGYELFAITRHGVAWRAAVGPMYYGLLMFARAAPPGSRLIRVSVEGAGGSLAVWATLGRDRRTRIVLINKSTSAERVVTLRAPALAGPVSLERLTAPGAGASTGVTLGGQSFGPSTSTGVLAGPTRVDTLEHVGSRYVITLPAASAALLTANER